MDKLLRIAWYTVHDQLQRKGFYLLLAGGIWFVFSLRGCYDARLVVNHQQLDPMALAGQASFFAFHFIAVGMLLMAVLISMSILPRDEEDGSTVLYLCRPVARFHYLLGRLTGLWLLLSLFMLLLHGTIMLMAWQKTGNLPAGYLVASLLCSINLFFALGLTLLCSLILPGFVAALTVIAVIGLGFLSDNTIRLLHSSLAQNILQGEPVAELPWWRLFYPKLAMVQHYGATLISNKPFSAIGPVHPLVNVVLCSVVVMAVLLFVFARKEL